MAGRGGKKDDVLSRLLARSSWAAYRSRAHQLPHQALVSANLPPFPRQLLLEKLPPN